MVAVSLVELIKVVGRFVPFQLTIAPLTKPAPVTVNVKSGSPPTAVSGVRFRTAGVTVTLLGLEVRLVGVEFKTVTEKIPTAAMSDEEIDAVNLVELTKVVDLLVPFQRTFEPLIKPAPFTVRVNPLPPTLTTTGERLVMDGFTVRLLAADKPPPGLGLKTVTGNRPAFAMSLAVSEVVSWLLLTKVVGLLLPLKRTTEAP